jgi:hypothetical protein
VGGLVAGFHAGRPEEPGLAGVFHPALAAGGAAAGFGAATGAGLVRRKMGADAAAAGGAAGKSGRAVAWIFLGLGLCTGWGGAPVSTAAEGAAGSPNSGKPFSRK